MLVGAVGAVGWVVLLMVWWWACRVAASVAVSESWLVGLGVAVRW